VGVRALCAPAGVGVPLTASPALLVRAAAPPGLVRTVVAGPDLEVREVRDGELLLAGEYGGETSRDDLRRSADATLARLRGIFRGAEQVRLVGVEVGMRPMPVDGLPLVGPVPGRPGLYLAVMHAGVTLAPVVGRLVAADLAEGRHVPEFDGVRPDRVPASGPAPAERI
jgi:glycine/D-amino acid oxidase-like deaminating enzyme